MHLRQILMFFIFIVSTNSCVKKPTTSNTPKWGHLDDFGGFGLAELLPNQTVTVCDKGQGAAQAIELVKSGILEWAATIQRDKAIKVQTGCSGGAMNIDLLMEGGCGGAAAYTQPIGGGQFTITYCSPEFVTMKDINIHEVGHIWMQCDRYGGGDLSQAKFGDNCSQTYTNGVETSSAMMAGGPSHPQRVTEDDRDGMIALAKRTDSSKIAEVNKKWQDYLVQNPGSGNLPNSSSPPGVSPQPSSGPLNPSQSPLPDAQGSIAAWCTQLRQKLNAGGQPNGFEEEIGALLCP